MTIVDEGDVTTIVLDEDEADLVALRAIIKSSFASAPVDTEWSRNESTYSMSDEEADMFIRTLPRKYDGLVIQIAKVDGRVCNTLVRKVGERTYSLDNLYYSRSPEERQKMLRSANHELHGVGAGCPPITKVALA